MARPCKCPFCGATDSVSKGVRKTKTMGVRHIRLCKACGRKFTPENQNAVEAHDPGTAEQGEPRNQEEGTEPNAPRQEDAESPTEPEAPAEPAEALARVFPPPDEQWTS